MNIIHIKQNELKTKLPEIIKNPNCYHSIKYFNPNKENNQSKIWGRQNVWKYLKGTGKTISKEVKENSIMIYNQKYQNYNRLNHNKIQEIKAHKKIYKII